MPDSAALAQGEAPDPSKELVLPLIKITSSGSITAPLPDRGQYIQVSEYYDEYDLLLSNTRARPSSFCGHLIFKYHEHQERIRANEFSDCTEWTENNDIKFDHSGFLIKAGQIEYAAGGFPNVCQQHELDCWAVGFTLLKSWDEGTSYSVDEVMSLAGSEFHAKWLNGEMAEDIDMKIIADRFGMIVEMGQCLSPQEWWSMLQSYGPLFVALDVLDSTITTQSIYHSVLLTGIDFDCNPETRDALVRVIRTDDGSFYNLSFRDFEKLYTGRGYPFPGLVHFPAGRGYKRHVLHFRGNVVFTSSHDCHILRVETGGPPRKQVISSGGSYSVEIADNIATATWHVQLLSGKLAGIPVAIQIT